MPYPSVKSIIILQLSFAIASPELVHCTSVPIVTLRYENILHIIILHTGDMTGEYSAYTIYEGHEIMFHVSTMLPYSKDNRQQVNIII